MKKVVILVLSLLLLGLVLVGCGETVEPKAENIQLFKDGETNYSIIYSDKVPADLKSEIDKLNSAISLKAGKSLELKEDTISEALGLVETDFEIVIGDCNRSVVGDLKASLRTDDYIIKVVDKKIVIIGGSNASTVEAVLYFRRNCIPNNESENIVFDGDLLIRQNGIYNIGELKLNGIDIYDYVIVYENDTYKPAANRFNEQIAWVSGFSLTMKNYLKVNDQDKHKIMFGDCGTGVSAGVKTDNGSYKILSDEKDVGIIAFSAMQADDAVIDIIDKYFPKVLAETFNIEIKSGTDTVFLYEGSTLKTMTMNLWETGYDEKASSQIINRNPYLIKIFDEVRPDIICFQEASHDRKNPNNKSKSTYDYVKGDLDPLYNVVCDKRTDDNGSSFTPVFYRADLYSVVDFGCYKFADRYPDSNNKSLAWVVFESRINGKRFGIMNCHFALFMEKYNGTFGFENETNAGLGDEWRKGNVAEVISRYTEMRGTYGSDLPVLIMGDLNMNPNKESYKMMHDYEAFSDCREVATISSTQGKSSWHDCGSYPANGLSNLLDHVFVTEDVITVLTHEILINSTSIKASDHCPVICEFQFK